VFCLGISSQKLHSSYFDLLEWQCGVLERKLFEIIAKLVHVTYRFKLMRIKVQSYISWCDISSLDEGCVTSVIIRHFYWILLADKMHLHFVMKLYSSSSPGLIRLVMRRIIAACSRLHFVMQFYRKAICSKDKKGEIENYRILFCIAS